MGRNTGFIYDSPMPVAAPVFVSYSHKDADWLERCQPFLRPLHRAGLIELWDDTRIYAGDEWRCEILNALKTARVAVLLVSQNFLDSDFILKHELPPLLQAAEDRGLKVLWIPLGHCTYEDTPLEKYQCVGQPDHPLVSLHEDEMQLALKHLNQRIREIVNVQVPTTPEGQRIFLVPYERNPAFTGREDILAELDKALLKGSGALSQVAAISGLGGVGKTQTAVEYVYRHRDQYTAVLWAVAESDQTLAPGYAEIARHLGLAGSEEQNQATIRDAVKAWLEKHDGWLLVLDNADTPALLKPYLPRQHDGCVLITSRAYTLQELGIFGLLRLDTLPPQEASTFLFTRTGRDPSTSSQAEQMAATDLVQELGYLPLALEQAAAYLVETGASFSAYLASYRKRRLQLLEAGKAREHPDSVATTWDLNFAEVEKTPASADLLRVSSFLAPETIPLDLLAVGAGEIEGPLGAELARIAGDPLVLDELLAPLLRYSLAKREPASPSFSVHRLIQAVVRERLGEERGKFWAERAMLALNAAFPYIELESWPTCDRLIAHAQVLAGWIEHYTLYSLHGLHILNQAGYYLWTRGQYTAAELLFRQAISIQEETLGTDTPSLADSLNNLAELLRERDNFDGAKQLHRRALNIRERDLPPGHPDIAQSLHNLGLVLTQKREFDAAEPLLRRAVAICEQEFGLDHRITATCLNNLGRLLHEKGDYEAAEPLLRRALAIREQALSPRDPDIALSLKGLALLVEEKGDLEAAESLLRRGLVILEQALGPTHPKTMATRNNLVSLVTDQGRAAEANELRLAAEQTLRSSSI